MTSQEVDSFALLNELIHGPSDGWLELKRLEAALGHEVEKKVTYAGGSFVTRKKVR